MPAAKLERELGQRLVDVRPLPLAERALRAGHARAHDRAQPPQRVQPQDLRLDVELRQPVADDRVLGRPVLARLGEQLGQCDLHADLQPEGERRALVHERRDRDGPPVALAADDVLVRDPRLFDEQLVELGLAGDLPQRAHLDRVSKSTHEEVRQPLVARNVRVRPCDEHAPLRVMGERRPHLLPGDDPLVPVAHRARLQRREVRAGLGLGEPLAPDLVGAEDGLEVALLLLLGAVRDDCRPAHRQAQHVRRARRLRAGELLVVDRLLDERRAAPAVLLRPGHAGPVVLVQAPLPRAAELESRDVAFGLGSGVVRLDPGPQLVAERLLLRCRGQVHGGGHSTARSDGNREDVTKGAKPPDRDLASPRPMRAVALIALLAALLTGALAAPAAAAPDPVLAALQRAEAAGALPPAQGVLYRQTLAKARSVRDGLRGVRRREIASVLTIAGQIAKRGDLTAPRMPAVFLTIERNAEWWAPNAPPVAGSPGENGARGRRCKPLPARARAARISFPGSELVFQYYPGLGLQLQVNGTWGRANALFGSSNPAFWARGNALLGELLPLADLRGGVLAWEHESPIFGGRPPWVSALSQATAVQALTRAAGRLGRPDLLHVAGAAARAFAFPPPAPPARSRPRRRPACGWRSAAGCRGSRSTASRRGCTC